MTVSPLSRTSGEKRKAPGRQPVADRLRVANGGAPPECLGHERFQSVIHGVKILGILGRGAVHGRRARPGEAPTTRRVQPRYPGGSGRRRRGRVGGRREQPDDGGPAPAARSYSGIAHMRASWGKKGPRRSRKSDARRRAGPRAGWVFAGCPCASDPDVGLGRYIVGAERRVGGAGAAAVVCRGGAGRGGRRRRRSSWELTGRSGLVLFSTIKYWVDFGQESVWSGERKRESRRSVVPAHFKFLGNLIEKCPHFRDMAWKKCVECQYAKLYILISYFCN